MLLKPERKIFTKRYPGPIIRFDYLLAVVVWLFFSGSFFLESCSPGRARLTYPLSDKTVVSADGLVRLRIPDGWFVPEDGETTPALLVWLVAEDQSATMGLTEIRGDERLREEVKEAGLEVLGHLSFSLKQERYPTTKLLRAPGVFRLKRSEFCSYEYTSDDGATTVRTVVFYTGDKFYELTAIPNVKKLSGTLQRIFSAQQAILQTMEWSGR